VSWYLHTINNLQHFWKKQQPIAHSSVVSLLKNPSRRPYPSSPPVRPAAMLDTTSLPTTAALSSDGGGAALDGGSLRPRCARTAAAPFHGITVASLHGGGSAPLRSATTPRPLSPPWPCQPASAARPRAPTRLTISSSTSSAALAAVGGAR
jgi:hypothetical protein